MTTLARNVVAPLLAGVALFVLGCASDAGEVAREHVTRAQTYRAAKQYSEAVIELRRAIQLEPRNGEARRQLADTYARMDDWANASRESVRVADLLPGDIEAQLGAAELLIIGRRFQDARARADRALAIEPGNVRALLLKGHSAAGLRDLDAALTEVEDAISLDPGRGLSYATLGQLQWARGDTSAAAAAFAKAVAIDPASVQAHLARANFEWASGDAAAAEASLRLVLRLEARNLPAHRALALLLIATQRMADAGPHLELVADVSGEGRARLALADFYLLTGRTEEGAALLAALGASADPAVRTPARLRLAVVAGGAGKPQEAARIIEALAHDEPADALALTAQAELRYASGDAAAALHSSQAAMRADPRLARARFVHGQILLALGRADEAISSLAEAAQLDSITGEPQIALARVYLARGDADLALSFATEGVARQPLNLQARIALARALVAGQHLEAAQQAIETIERSLLPVASIHTTRAMFELARKRPAAAELAVQRALALAPADTDALSLLTRLDTRPDRAAAAVTAAAAQPQAAPELLLLAARTQAANGDVKAAEMLARQVLAAQPSSAAAYQLLGELYASAGRLDDARHEFERILQLQPASVMAHTLVGILLQMQNRPADAERHYEAAVQADARGAGVAANNLAWLIAERNGNLDIALQHAQSAVAALRDSAGPKDTLGWIYYRKGMPERAVAALKEAVEQEPGSARYHYHLGLAYAAAGDSRQATHSLERALAIQPDFVGSADARAVLGRLAAAQ